MTLTRTRTLLRLPASLLLTAVCVAGLAGCSSTDVEVDSDGRWVGGGETMTAWAEANVPTSWQQVDESVTYEDLIDDLGEDTGSDRTNYAAKYRGVTEAEFAQFGTDVLEIDGDLECEPYDEANALPEDKPYVKDCFLDLYQGEDPLTDEFDLFAVWTSFADGSTVTRLYLGNDPQ